MKFVAKVGSLALIAAAAGGVVAGCSSQDVTKPSSAQGEGQKGTVGLTLQPVAGITINQVHYTVTKSDGVTKVTEGDVPTPGTASTFSFGLPLPVGTGYTLAISGVSVENNAVTCTGASAPFNVAPNLSSKLTLVLTCTDATNGNLETGVTVTTDACPRLIVDYVVATPSTAFLPNGTIAVASSARDLDGKPVTYSWKVSTPAVGSFAPVNAATSTFTCAQDSGADTVDVIVTANNGQCSKSLPTTVACKNLSCGNGVLDAGEECDPAIPSGPNCLPNCTTPKCGNGVVDAPFETCDLVPANLGVCSATCQTVTASCGDGFINGSEQCDASANPPVPASAPAGATCSATCTLNTPIVCGDGVVQTGEVCDPGLTKNDCGRDCKTITSAACFACESAPDTCAASVLTCDTAAGGTTTATVTGKSGADKATDPGAVTTAVGAPKAPLCNEVLDCVRDSGCAANGNPALKSCYCGTASVSQCNSGLGNGPCKAELERALEATDFATVSQRVGNSLYGGGVAMKRIDCDQSFCDPVCFQ